MADHRLRQINALVIGGGALGQVIGKHLAAAGVHIGLLVKHKYASVVDEGFEMHHFAPFGKHSRRRFDDFKIYHDFQTLSEKHFDQIYVCTSSPDLKSGWLEELFPHFRHAIWVIMQPGLRDYEYVASIVPERYIVQGTPGFLAYRGPLQEGSGVYPPGVAWWRPPLQSTRFEGPDDQTTTAVTRLLNAGGLKCAVATDLMTDNLHHRSLVVPFAMALESHGWSIDALADDKGTLGVLTTVVGQLHDLVEKATGRPSRRNRRYTKRWYCTSAMKAFRWLTPFSLERYCEQHFLKRRRELEQLADDFIALGESVGAPTNSLSAMREYWRSTRRAPDGLVEDDLTPAGMVVPEFDRPEVSFGSGGSAELPSADSSSTPAPFDAAAQRPFSSGTASSLKAQSGSSTERSAVDPAPQKSGQDHTVSPSVVSDLPEAPGSVGGARPIASGDVSETGPMEQREPREVNTAAESDDVSQTAPMKREPGPRHSLSFSSKNADPEDHTAPVPVQPTPSFLDEETDAGD